MAYSAVEFNRAKVEHEQCDIDDVLAANIFEYKLDEYLKKMIDTKDYSNILTKGNIDNSEVYYFYSIVSEPSRNEVVESILLELSSITQVRDYYYRGDIIFSSEIDLNEYQLSIIYDRYIDAGWNGFTKYEFLKTNEFGISLFLSVDDRGIFTRYIICECENPPKFFYQLIKIWD